MIIDSNRLDTVKRQTEDAQEILNQIFEDDISSAYDYREKSQPNDEIEIAKYLSSKAVWEHDEVGNICNERNLILSAVLEQINDFAYEIVDDVFVEDDGDFVYVNLDYAQKLL